MFTTPALTLLLMASTGDLPEHAPSFAITMALADAFDGFDDKLRYGIEYRFAPLTHLDLVPVAGITTAANGATFVYGDLRRQFSIASNWHVRGSFGLGRYDPDDIIDLGHMLEFRTGAMIVYQSPSGIDLELALYHFSNGGIGHTNPGTEAVVLSFAFPFGE